MQLVVDLVRNRNGASDLAAHNFAITLPQPMDMRLYCCSRKTCARRCVIIRGQNAASGKKGLQLFEKLEFAFSLNFFTQGIQRTGSERFRPTAIRIDVPLLNRAHLRHRKTLLLFLDRAKRIDNHHRV